MTAPERIYLQDAGDYAAAAEFEVTWCVDPQDPADTEYTRADLIPAAALAVPEVRALVEAATTLHRSMELFFEADEAADEAERDGCQKEAARLRNMANGRWQSIPGNLDSLAAALRGVEGQP